MWCSSLACSDKASAGIDTTLSSDRLSLSMRRLTMHVFAPCFPVTLARVRACPSPARPASRLQVGNCGARNGANANARPHARNQLESTPACPSQRVPDPASAGLNLALASRTALCGPTSAHRPSTMAQTDATDFTVPAVSDALTTICPRYLITSATRAR